MSLFKIDYDTPHLMYCGPTAIAAVTGRSATQVLDAIAFVRGNEKRADSKSLGIRGMYQHEVKAVIALLGYHALDWYKWPSPQVTLARYFAEYGNWQNFNRIVNIRRHFIAVGIGNLEVCDTGTKQPICANKSPHRRARVKCHLIITGPK